MNIIDAVNTLKNIPTALNNIAQLLARLVPGTTLTIGPGSAGAPSINFSDALTSGIYEGTLGAIGFSGGEVHTLRVVTAAGAVTVARTDYIIVVNKTVGAATTVNLPAAPVVGEMFIIKDGRGDAGANNITITPAAGNIDGAGTLVINTNFGLGRVVFNGVQYNSV